MGEREFQAATGNVYSVFKDSVLKKQDLGRSIGPGFLLLTGILRETPGAALRGGYMSSTEPVQVDGQPQPKMVTQLHCHIACLSSFSSVL